MSAPSIQLLQVASNPLPEIDNTSSAQAASRFKALMALDMDPERQELRAAGVPERSIASLYPDDFDSLVAGLANFLKKDRPYTKFDENWWGYHSGAMSTLNGLLSDELEKQRNAALEIFAASGKFDLLLTSLAKKLKPHSAQERATTMLLCLWNAHWHMVHLSVSGISPKRVQTRFTSVFEWVLPTFMETMAQPTRTLVAN